MPRALTPGARGPAVRLLQERLTALGFYVGPMDGAFGDLTADAVRRFQKAFRLTCDGVAGPQVWSLLRDPLLPAGGAGGPPSLPLSRMPVPRLVVGWAAGPDTPDVRRRAGAFSWEPSGWVRPWAEVAVEAGRPRSSLLEVRGPQPPAAGDVGGAEGCGVEAATGCPRPPGLTVEALRVRLRVPAALARLAAGKAARAVERYRAGRAGTGDPLGPVLLLMAAPWEAPWASEPGAPPIGSLLHMARLLGRRQRVWLGLPAPARASARNLYWWGYQIGRLSGPVERLVAWLPPPTPQDPLPGLASLKLWVRGVAAFSPPWRVLVGLDLAPWLYAVGDDGRPSPPRRLSQAEAVVWAWRLRRGQAASGAVAGAKSPEAAAGAIGQRDADSMRRLALLVRWAGLGGLVVAGVERADPRVWEALRASLPPLLVPAPGICMGPEGIDATGRRQDGAAAEQDDETARPGRVRTRGGEGPGAAAR